MAQIYLIGAGPGDPGLLTVKGREVLRSADVVVYDYLVNPILLKEARPTADKIYVGKIAGQASINQEDINSLLVRLGREGKTVARLKGGDPFVFGRGGEEAQALQAAGLIWEVVPGVSSAVAVPAYAGIPVTHGGIASRFTVITGHDGGREAGTDETLVYLMGVEHVAKIAAQLMSEGRSPQTPVAIVRWGTTWQQTTLTGQLLNIAEVARQAGLTSPAVIIVGEVAGLREGLRWFDRPEARPLLGRRIVVTRAREQAAEMLATLTNLGADALEFSVIKIVDPPSFEPMDSAIERLSTFNWAVFTSVNGVEYFWRRLKRAGKDARAFANLKICAIGPATAAALEERNIVPDMIPGRFVAEGILDDLGDVSGQKFLLPRADIAREALVEGLEARGAVVENVVAYRTIAGGEEGPGSASPADMVKWLEAGEIDIVTFTSSSTVRNFAARLRTSSDSSLPELLSRTTVACIGPITAGTARDLGLTVGLEAAEFTIDKLVETIVQHFSDLATVG